MAVVIGGVTCQELVDGYTESYELTGGPGARKGYLCPWASRFAVVHGILGLSSTPAVGGLITLNVPMAFPELAAESTNSLASMYAKNVEVYGVGSPVQGTSNIAFTSAKVYVTFGYMPWTFTGVDYLQLDPSHPYIWAEQNIDTAGEYITVPGSNVFVNPGGGVVALNQDWGFFSPLADMSITLKNVPYLPIAADLAALAAPINSVAYLQCNPGFLMYKGMHSNRTAATDGTPTAEITLGFSYRPIAQWDYIYYKGAWLQVTDSGGTAVTGRSDLSVIIPSAYVI